jgi:hypothetical protein
MLSSMGAEKAKKARQNTNKRRPHETHPNETSMYRVTERDEGHA